MLLHPQRSIGRDVHVLQRLLGGLGARERLLDAGDQRITDLWPLGDKRLDLPVRGLRPENFGELVILDLGRVLDIQTRGHDAVDLEVPQLDVLADPCLVNLPGFLGVLGERADDAHAVLDRAYSLLSRWDRRRSHHLVDLEVGIDGFVDQGRLDYPDLHGDLLVGNLRPHFLRALLDDAGRYHLVLAVQFYVRA